MVSGAKRSSLRLFCTSNDSKNGQLLALPSKKMFFLHPEVFFFWFSIGLRVRKHLQSLEKTLKKVPRKPL